MHLPRRAVTFRAESGWAANLSWQTGPLPAGATVNLVTTVDPDDLIQEADETNNTRREGQGMAEYALILAPVAIVAIAGVIFLGPKLKEVFTEIGTHL